MTQKMIDAFERLRDVLAQELNNDDYLRSREMLDEVEDFVDDQTS